MIGPIQAYHRETEFTTVDREEPSDEDLSSSIPFCKKTRLTCGINVVSRRGWTGAGTARVRDPEERTA